MFPIYNYMFVHGKEAVPFDVIHKYRCKTTTLFEFKNLKLFIQRYVHINEIINKYLIMHKFQIEYFWIFKQISI